MARFNKHIFLGLIITWILMPNCHSFAGQHSTIRLNNGSVINGDIISQRPGDGLTVDVENATLVIDPKEIMSRTIRKVKYEDLSRELKRWSLENKALIGDAYGRYAELEDIRTKDHKFSGLVSKRDDGNKTMSYVLLAHDTLNFKWNEVNDIIKNQSSDIRYDLFDEVVTNGGKTFKGRIISQKTGEKLTMETSSGRVDIANKDIAEIRKLTRDGSDGYLDKTDYKNILRLKNGTESHGVITAYHYGRRHKDNFITFQDLEGKIQDVSGAIITEYLTEYKPTEKDTYQTGKVYLNEFRIDEAKMQSNDDRIVFVDKKVFPFPEGITTTFKTKGDSLSGNWTLVALSRQQTAEGPYSWGYEINEKEDNTVRPDSAEIQSEMNTITYGYLSPGFYALVNESDTKAYVFKITK